MFCDHSAASESAWEAHRRDAHPKPRRDFKGPLAPYLIHASAYGTESVFETVLANAPRLAGDPRQRVRRLALLARRLHEIDPRWKSPLGMEHAILLHDQGHDAQTIADLLGVTRATVQRRIRSILHGSGPCDSALQKPANTGRFAAFPTSQADGPGYADNDPSPEASWATRRDRSRRPLLDPRYHVKANAREGAFR